MRCRLPLAWADGSPTLHRLHDCLTTSLRSVLCKHTLLQFLIQSLFSVFIQQQSDVKCTHTTIKPLWKSCAPLLVLVWVLLRTEFLTFSRGVRGFLVKSVSRCLLETWRLQQSSRWQIGTYLLRIITSVHPWEIKVGYPG